MRNALIVGLALAGLVGVSAKALNTSSLNSDAGSLNCSSLATGCVANASRNKSNVPVNGKSAYLITNVSGTVLTHVNATDLQNGTALVGGAWSISGTPTYNAGDTPRPSIGGFNNSTYFSQSSGPSNVGAGPWTGVQLLKPTSSGTTVPFEPGQVLVNGYFLQFTSPSNLLGLYNSNGTVVAQPTNAANLNAFNVFIFGVDSAGIGYAQVNGGTTATASSIAESAGTSSFIGIVSSGILPFTGDVYELLISTAVPSSTAFTNLFNAIIAAE
jgi:hypothetical protein